MAVDVKKVSNRRSVRYQTLQDLVEDAERLGAGEVKTLGNRSFEEILSHLALVMNGCIDSRGDHIRFPLHIRVLARVLRGYIFSRGLTPGRQLSADADRRLWPQGKDMPDALEDLRQAIRRLEAETKRGAHPAFGKLNVSQWNQFHLRHAELHMSFVVPA